MSITMLTTGIIDKLNAMVGHANTLPQYFLRTVKPKYLKAQKERWMGEGATEYTEGKWKPLSDDYARIKPQRFKDYPGKGSKLLIAKNTLVNSILALSTDYREVVGDRTYIVSTVVPYAEWVDKDRTITHFNDNFYTELRESLAKYLKVGQ